MPIKKAAKKKTGVTPKRAYLVAKKAQKRFKGRVSKSRAWQKGGKEYSRVLGHFGLTE